jgi:hypothetical protein
MVEDEASPRVVGILELRLIRAERGRHEVRIDLDVPCSLCQELRPLVEVVVGMRLPAYRLADGTAVLL